MYSRVSLEAKQDIGHVRFYTLKQTTQTPNTWQLPNDDTLQSDEICIALPSLGGREREIAGVLFPFSQTLPFFNIEFHADEVQSAEIVVIA